jgi:menaquinone-dependent protoporphyrinogen oxidase
VSVSDEKATTPQRLLVVYSSRHGATQGIAERIAARLTEHGCLTDLASVEEARDPATYDAVVFGSPVYDQNWPPEAQQFVDEHRSALAARPLWLFSVGSFGDTGRLWGRAVLKEPRGIDDLRTQLEPREYRVFAGRIERHQWPLWSRLFFRLAGGRFGDNRDWPEVDAWAARIAAAGGEPAEAVA